MSKASRLRAQKARQQDPRRVPFQRARPGEDIEVAFIPGLTVDDDAAVARMQKELHDVLIDSLGQRRRSGVRWRHVHERAECERVLKLMYGDNPAKWAAVQVNYFPFLAEYGDESVMVVAECDAVQP